MVCTFYDPAYVTIDQWFEGRSTGPAIGMLTLAGGLAASILAPLTQRLVEGMAWRDATLVLATVRLAVVGTLALVFLRNRPWKEVQREGLDLVRTYGALVEGLRYTDWTFWLVSVSFFLGPAANFALLFHQVAYLQELGFLATLAALVAGIAALIGLPGRFLLPTLGDRPRPSFVAAAVFFMLALCAFVLPGAEEPWRLYVYVYVGLSGICFGTILPLRAVVIGRRCSGPVYGRLMGLQLMLLSLAIARGPLAAGVLRDVSGSYALLPPVVITLLLPAIPTVLAAEHRPQST